MLTDPDIKGVILTVPNEQHLPLAREVAKAGKHVYTEKPIASTLEEGLGDRGPGAPPTASASRSAIAPG